MLVDAMVHNQKPITGRKDSFPQLYIFQKIPQLLMAFSGDCLG